MHIVHLYPETLGLFGDAGNVLALRKRCEWFGVDDVRVSPVSRGAVIPSDGDVYVIGSGSSNSVRLAAEGINALRDALDAAVARDATILAVGAGLHLLGNSIAWPDGSRTQGAAILDAESVPLTTRLVGEFVGQAQGIEVAGFFNTGHRVDSNLPAHIISVAMGDASESMSDGIEWGPVIGTHAHGSYLPMNPAIADAIIARTVSLPVGELPAPLVRANFAAEASRSAIRSRLRV